MRLRLPVAAGIVLLGAIVGVPQSAIAQTGWHAAGTLDPWFAKPFIWDEWLKENSGPLQPIGGLKRGADGWLYGITETDRVFTIFRVNPATGAARVVYVLTVPSYGYYPPTLVAGREGRLYFTMVDYGYVDYVAPGQSVDPGWGTSLCEWGCVVFLDTAHNGDLLMHHRFDTGNEDVGYYVSYGSPIWEDTDGAIYVETQTRGGGCIVGENWFPRLARIAWDAAVTSVPSPGCNDPSFDWSTVTPSGNDIWHWSDGQGTDADGPRAGLAEASGYLYSVDCCANRDVVYRLRVPSLASPDLIVTALSDPPASSAPGRSFSVTDTTRNESLERAASSATSHYLSFTGEHADIKLANSRYLPELGRFEESSGSVTVSIPATAPVGTYWLVACADAKLDVAEVDDLNNCRASATTILLSRPDLMQSAISNPPAAAQPGGAFTVTDTVENVGSVSALASSTRYYFSTDAMKGAGDVLLTGTRSVPILARSIESTGSRAVTIPAATPLATYYVLACADDLKKVSEANEGNNCRASASRVIVARPDLATSAVSDPPGQTAPGRTFSISDTVVNQGQATAVASSTRYYFSLDALRNAGDVLLTRTRAVPLLVPSASSTAPRTVTVPTTTPTGTYRVLACADDTAKIVEGLETNNCAASTRTVQVLYPDLVQLAVSNPPASAAVGASFTITDTVANPGAIATLTTKSRYYLSLDTVKGAGDAFFLASRSVASVAAGGQNTGVRAVTIPTLAAGTYYLLACADDTKLAIESNEGNNCKHAAATIPITP